MSAPDLQATPITLGTAKKLTVGQRVYAIGAPKGLELTLSEGLVSSLHPYEGSLYIQTSAAISPGSSGGGLFDDQGRLIGITTFYLAEGQGLNFALPVDWISELPKRAQTAPPVAKKGELDWFNRTAGALAEKEDWRGLQKLSQQWVKSEHENAMAWYSLGIAYNQLKQYDQAIQAYRELLRIRPEDADTWHILGTIYNVLKQYNQAIQAYREALRIQPEDADAWFNLGVAYYFLGQRDKVREIYQTLRKLDPALAERYFNNLILP